MAFTYYGDLLGVSNAYRLSPFAAYQQLNEFYNLTFARLRSACEGLRPANVNMFSDSVLFWGEDQLSGLRLLEGLYCDLLSRGLMLRGAIVEGALDFEPRFTVQNFVKQLPQGDVLPRAVALAGSVKGARLLVDPRVAHAVLPSVAWHSIEGYLGHLRDFPEMSANDVRRFISPAPEGTGYEVLYFGSGIGGHRESTASRIKETAAMTARDYQAHYVETLAVLERGKRRAMQNAPLHL